MTERDQNRRQLEDGVDVLIVGGGINGAGLARDLALRGARVGLVEQNDWASGTSSRSSRLIHGGLRYLEESYKSIRAGLLGVRPRQVSGGVRQIGLVFESVTERYWMSRLARNLVRPVPFVFPVVRGGRVPFWQMKAGVRLYDWLALFRNYRNHRALAPDEVTRLLPAIDESLIEGAVFYYDYRTNDARLTLENVIAARQAGAAVLSHARAVTPLFDTSGRTRRLGGAVIRDEQTGETFDVRATVVVSAAGPWTDDALRALGRPPSKEPLLRLTKGVHLVVSSEKLPLAAAAALTHPRDGRVLFALPFHERSVIGTTDTDWKGAPDDVRVESADVDYLLEVAAKYFPKAKLGRDDVISSWAGLRPLVNAGGLHESSVPREHRILRTDEGLIAIFGGKLTTYRRMVEELADVVADALEERTGQRLSAGTTRGLPLPGADTLDTDRDLEDLMLHLRHRGGISRATARHLAESYGDNAPKLLDIAFADPTQRLKARVYPDLPHLWVEIAWAARHEMALTLEDALVRRTSLHHRALDQASSIAPDAARIMGAELGWTDAQTKSAVEAYERFVAASRAWRNGTPSTATVPERAAS